MTLFPLQVMMDPLLPTLLPPLFLSLLITGGHGHVLVMSERPSLSMPLISGMLLPCPISWTALKSNPSLVLGRMMRNTDSLSVAMIPFAELTRLLEVLPTTNTSVSRLDGTPRTITMMPGVMTMIENTTSTPKTPISQTALSGNKILRTLTCLLSVMTSIAGFALQSSQANGQLQAITTVRRLALGPLDPSVALCLQTPMLTVLCLELDLVPGLLPNRRILGATISQSYLPDQCSLLLNPNLP